MWVQILFCNRSHVQTVCALTEKAATTPARTCDGSQTDFKCQLSGMNWDPLTLVLMRSFSGYGMEKQAEGKASPHPNYSRLFQWGLTEVSETKSRGQAGRVSVWKQHSSHTSTFASSCRKQTGNCEKALFMFPPVHPDEILKQRNKSPFIAA